MYLELVAMASKPVAVITGGTRGIGRGIAEALAEDGFDLLVSYNSNVSAAEDFVAELGKRYPATTCAIVGGDIALQDTRTALFQTLDNSFAGQALRAMVHNAGQVVGVTSTNASNLQKKAVTFGDGSICDDDGMPDLQNMKYYQALYGEAFVDLCERALLRMNGDGSLVGISSPGCNVTMRPVPGYSLMGSGKCIMEFALRTFALTTAEKNVNCNVVIPGYVLSEAWEKVMEARNVTKSALITQVEERVPMKRAAEAREIGDVVAFLCSAKGKYVTGLSIPVDGGLHLK